MGIANRITSSPPPNVLRLDPSALVRLLNQIQHIIIPIAASSLAVSGGGIDPHGAFRSSLSLLLPPSFLPL
jgi:hypothetical protein